MEVPKVIYEDTYLLALDKPPGWVVNEALSTSNTQTLQSWLQTNYKYEIAHSIKLRSGIVHRLDKPTSGVILVAKNEAVFYALQKQFADRTTKKTYLALVHGKVKLSTGTIDAPIGRLPWNRMHFGVLQGARQAITDYKVLEFYPNFSFLELYPKTGRTHQLRVHLKYLGHPIAGDHLYAGRKTARADLKRFGRLFLHAASLEFTHPVTKKRLKIESHLPHSLQLILSSLQKENLTT
ncbi:RluA family pseudouridine synthase [Patescibacteria group bacterium]|nr:RluA family pseudouridine synthase [Patescibacteria group bacterium]